MNKIIILLFFFFFLPKVQADDLRISMGNATGSYQNVLVRIENKGTAAGGARYDSGTRSIINTSDGTDISISNVEFGTGRYGLYNRVFIEYTNPVSCADACFDICLENTTTPIASIPVERTMEGEYKETSSTLLTNVVGKHQIYIRWKGHSAAIKTFGGNELKPFAEVKAVRSGSPLAYKFSKTYLEEIEGVHNLKMVWKNQSATVFAVYLDKDMGTSVYPNVMNHAVNAFIEPGKLNVCSEFPLGKVDVYLLTGVKVFTATSYAYSVDVYLKAGTYILRVTNENVGVFVKKVQVFN